jgi:Bacterial SH3 domain.
MKKTALILACVLCLCAVLPASAAGYVSGDYMGSDGTKAIVISRNVSIRVSPDTRSQRLASATNGEVLTVTGEEGAWLAVDYQDAKGNVYSGWALSTYLIRGAMTLTLLSSNIPAYCAPSRSSKQVGSLAKGTELTVLGTWGDFYIVNLREAAAYISMSADLEVSFGEAIIPGESGSLLTAVAQTDTLLRSGPGSAWASVAIVPSGAAVSVLSVTEDGWAQVQYGESSGYVLYADLNVQGGDGLGNG